MLPRLLTGPNPDYLFTEALKLWPTANDQRPTTNDQRPTHPDLHLYPDDPATSSIGIALIRDLIKTIQFKPTHADTKLVIIQHAQLLTTEAQNALLKTLEEPPDHVQIVLLTPNPYSLLPTILSRVILTPVETLDSNVSTKPSTLTPNSSILSLSPALRLLQTPTLAKDRDTAREFITQLMHYYHSQLIKNPSTSYELLATVKLLTKTLTYLDANTHPQLTIDYLLLNLPQNKI